MRIKIVANNCEWNSWGDKIKELEAWFAPKVSMTFEIEHVSFLNVPFTTYANADVIDGTADQTAGIEYGWYDQFVTPLGIGYDIIIFVMNLTEWKGKTARGWRTENNDGPIQLQVGCNENEEIIWPNFPLLGAFFQIARHELMHALFMISGQKDTTHYFWNQGKLELARDSIVLDKNFSLAIIWRAINYILSKILKLNMEIQQLPKEEPKKIDQTTSNAVPTNRERFFLGAQSSLGKDASPLDKAADAFGCAETVNAIHKNVFGFEIGGDVSTYRMYEALKISQSFTLTQEALPGDVIISPTGFGGKNGITNGHVGIVGENGKVMSNESSTGKFEENYTIETWRKRYASLGGYPVLFFRRV